ncbi:hypothetical protein ACIGXF_16385 [Streptomyces sp. NPDC053086]|uniref:hypothetical protein n=1 Tax=unclassified Streptomyces TaxID=2593676 RepID=UPI0037D12EAE
MDERRPDTPAVDPSARADLSPVQQAYSDYVTHAVGCDDCRSADAPPCTTGDALFEIYRQLKPGRPAAQAMPRR